MDSPTSRARVGRWLALAVLVGAAVACSAPPVLPVIAAPGVAEVPAPVRGPRLNTASALAAIPITFAADSAVISDPEAVRRAAEALRADVAANALIVGYTADTPGPPAVAQRLSERRAAAVADELVASGVERSRLTTEGRGDADPFPTPAASRRVEIQVR
jgi:peptidoglycan-binding protein ArfA